jgi:hypothetical protein
VKGVLRVDDKQQEIDKRHGNKIKAFDVFNSLEAALAEMDRKHGFGIANMKVEEKEGVSD